MKEMMEGHMEEVIWKEIIEIFSLEIIYLDTNFGKQGSQPLLSGFCKRKSFLESLKLLFILR